MSDGNDVKRKKGMDGYEVLRKLGRGHYGSVFLFRHLKTGEKVAAKYIRKDGMDTESRLRLFGSEINTLSILTNGDSDCQDHIIQFRELRETRNHYLIVTDYAAGRTIDAHIRRKWAGSSSKDVLEVMKLAARSLRVVHRHGFAHRDIKASNIIADVDSSPITLKLLDFGLSCVNDDKDSKFVCMNRTCGTFQYMSPETHANKQKMYEYDKTDIYSLGILFYYMAVGKHLYDHVKNDRDHMKYAKIHADHGSIRTGSQTLDKLIEEMISLTPTKRPSTSSILRRLDTIENPRFRILA